MLVALRISRGFLLMLLLTLGIAAVGWRALSDYASRVNAASAAQALVGEINALAFSADRALAREAGAQDVAVSEALAKAHASIAAIGAFDGNSPSIERMGKSLDTFELAFREDAAQQLNKARLARSHVALVNRFQTFASEIAA